MNVLITLYKVYVRHLYKYHTDTRKRRYFRLYKGAFVGEKVSAEGASMPF